MRVHNIMAIFNEIEESDDRLLEIVILLSDINDSMRTSLWLGSIKKLQIV